MADHEHTVYRSVLEEKSIVRIRHVQVAMNGLEEPTLACPWVSNGIN